ncbi:glycosyltransferase [Nocardia sp. CA2R105]|uniref:glycosyltransferase n=1 Tax=Nocardia coffeae TaxID=2873381 RepID=UPI001CA73C16|nr:glycosyltransferase [Nocardia coffeae]MBY8860226.1 glycosyltransferase [Nocardia coffeae]
MRILFGSTPVPGHVLPLLPLADAAVAAGHEVAFLTAKDMAPFLHERTLRPAGASFEQIAMETAARSTVDSRHPGAGAAELFAGVRVDLTWDEALPAAEDFAPDVLVCETMDYVTQLLAARLDLPWFGLTVGAPLPDIFTDALAQRAEQQHHQRGLTPRTRSALLDPHPLAMRVPTDPPAESDRMDIRPVAHRDAVPGLTTELTLPPAGDRPRVLVTTGTSVGDRELFDALAQSLVEAGAEVLVTTAADTAVDRPHVHAIGFAPLAEVLPEIDVVVGAAGSGTLLATLANGTPSILLPQIADQPANAARAVAHESAVLIETPEQAGPALSTLLGDDRYRAGARRLAQAIAEMPHPEDVAKRIFDARATGRA